MSKEVTVEELRERLDEVLSDMENGKDVVILRDGKRIGIFRPAVVQKGVPYPFRNLMSLRNDFFWRFSSRVSI
jgi:hypothetical protein